MMSVAGTSRYFAAMQWLGRSGAKADIGRRGDWTGSVAFDPKRTSAVPAVALFRNAVARPASAAGVLDEFSARDCRERCANALREIGRPIGRLSSVVDKGAPTQFVERQLRVDPA